MLSAFNRAGIVIISMSLAAGMLPTEAAKRLVLRCHAAPGAAYVQCLPSNAYGSVAPPAVIYSARPLPYSAWDYNRIGSVCDVARDWNC